MSFKRFIVSALILGGGVVVISGLATNGNFSASVMPGMYNSSTMGVVYPSSFPTADPMAGGTSSMGVTYPVNNPTIDPMTGVSSSMGTMPPPTGMPPPPPDMGTQRSADNYAGPSSVRPIDCNSKEKEETNTIGPNPVYAWMERAIGETAAKAVDKATREAMVSARLGCQSHAESAPACSPAESCRSQYAGGVFTAFQQPASGIVVVNAGTPIPGTTNFTATVEVRGWCKLTRNCVPVQ